MNCQRCGSERILSAGCKCSDRFGGRLGGTDIDGYVPDDLGIGGGDYVEFELCLDCGQLQGKFPLPVSNMEKEIDDNDLIEFFEENFSEGEYFLNIYSSRRDRISKDAERLGGRLRSYMHDMFSCHCDIGSESRAPSVSKWIALYKAGKFEL